MILESRLVYSLLVRSSENEQDQAVRLLCTTLLIDIWYAEYGLLLTMNPTTNNGTVRDAFFDVLKANLAHQDKVYRITIYGAAFALID